MYPKMDIKIYHAYIKKAKRKRDIHMCKPLDKIFSKTASEILTELGMSEEIPIQLEPILKHYGIAALPYDFSEIEQNERSQLSEGEDGEGNILGVMISNGDRAGIFYRKDDTVNRQRFTIAHELGHCATAHEPIKDSIRYRRDKISNDEKEILANTFAGALLIPEKSLRILHRAMPIPYTSLLAKAFAVSTNVMKARMINLELAYV